MEEGIKVSEEQAAVIEAETRAQGSQKWKSARKWRLTASNFGTICKATVNRDMRSLCKTMYDPPNLNSPPIRHGRTYESQALKKFTEVTGKKVLPSGFCIHPDLPYLGASPDGYVEGEDAVVEAKCPFAGRKSKITPGKLFPFLENVNGNMRLKKTHSHFYQINGQMKLARRSHGYFIVYTHEDFFYERIDLDEDFFAKEMLPLLKGFYENEYCPYVASVQK